MTACTWRASRSRSSSGCTTESRGEPGRCPRLLGGEPRRCIRTSSWPRTTATTTRPRSSSSSAGRGSSRSRCSSPSTARSSWLPSCTWRGRSRCSCCSPSRLAPRSTPATSRSCMALAIVWGFRHPWTWSFVLLTKVTPAVGLLWFVVRREWRNLGIALGASAVLAGAVGRPLVRPVAGVHRAHHERQGAGRVPYYLTLYQRLAVRDRARRRRGAGQLEVDGARCGVPRAPGLLPDQPGRSWWAACRSSGSRSGGCWPSAAISLERAVPNPAGPPEAEGLLSTS